MFNDGLLYFIELLRITIWINQTLLMVLVIFFFLTINFKLYCSFIICFIVNKMLFSIGTKNLLYRRELENNVQL